MKTLFSRHSILNDELPAATCVTGSPSSITLRWFWVVPSRVTLLRSGLCVSIFVIAFFSWASVGRVVRAQTLSLREREFINMARFSGAGTFEIIYKEIFPYLYSYIVVGFINTILFAINTEAALAVIGLSKIQVPTLGSIIFWALNYNALMIGQISWIIAPIVATVLLFLGLFLTSTGYNELFAERRGVA